MRTGEIVIIIFCGIPILAILCGLIWWCIETIKEKKFEKKYPEVFELIAKREIIQNQNIKTYNNEIAPIANKIDYIISQQKYMTKEDFIKSEIELEELRQRFKKGETEYHKNFKDLEHYMTKEIENMIRKDKKFLKFMKGRGWCKDE